MKKILFTALGLISLMAISVTYADKIKPFCNNTWSICQLKTEIKSGKNTYKTEIQALKDQEKANKEAIEANKRNFNANFGIARQYLVKPLTGDKRAIVNSIFKAKDKTMKDLQISTNALIKSWTVDRSWYISQATAILKWFRTSLLPYIATDKVELFDAFIQEKINLMINNITIKQIRTDTKMQIWTKKITLKERLNTKRVELKNIIKTMKGSE